jgi:2'-5' RNA ligase
MNRLFLAIPLPWEIKQIIADAAEEIKKQMKFSKISWVGAGNYHITLHFLGDVDIEKEERLIQLLRSKEYPAPFELRIVGIDAFPNKKSPQIIVIKTNIISAAFGLYKRTAGVCVSFGLNIGEKPWEPHVTVGRVRVQSEVLKPELINLPLLGFKVDSFVLMSSALTPAGSVYETVEEFKLES